MHRCFLQPREEIEVHGVRLPWQMVTVITVSHASKEEKERETLDVSISLEETSLSNQIIP